jgi:hypothetical protein
LSGEKRSVLRAEEPLVSYEQVLLSQINYCAKCPPEVFPLCVTNLISLLPFELRVEVLREYDEIKSLLVKYILEEVKNCRLEDGHLVCGLFWDDMYVAHNKVVSRVNAEKPELYLKHGHVLGGLVIDLLTIDKPVQHIAGYKLKFSIVLHKLLESKIIAPKSAALYVGRVEA